MTRVTQRQVQGALESLKDIGAELGIEGAEYWAVENPWGPQGLYLVERHHDDGHWVKQSTALGSYWWDGPKDALRGLQTLWNALRAAKKARG